MKVLFLDRIKCGWAHSWVLLWPKILNQKRSWTRIQIQVCSSCNFEPILLTWITEACLTWQARSCAHKCCSISQTEGTENIWFLILWSKALGICWEVEDQACSRGQSNGKWTGSCPSSAVTSRWQGARTLGLSHCCHHAATGDSGRWELSWHVAGTSLPRSAPGCRRLQISAGSRAPGASRSVSA